MPFFAVGCLLIAYGFRNLLKFRILYLILPFFLTSLFLVYGNPSKMLIPFRYYIKLGVGHLPRDVCPSPSETAKYRTQLAKYYDFSGTSNCFPLRAWPGYSERLKVLQQLDKLDFAKSDRAYGLLSTSRIQNYYMNHIQEYDQIQKLLPYLPESGGNIGIMFGKETGYYHHLQTIIAAKRKQFTMRCIYYKREYKVLNNARKEFAYKYVLSDSLSLVRHKIAPDLMQYIVKTEGISLVRLKEYSTKVYPY